jgi:hypothetical protein
MLVKGWWLAKAEGWRWLAGGLLVACGWQRLVKG